MRLFFLLPLFLINICLANDDHSTDRLDSLEKKLSDLQKYIHINHSVNSSDGNASNSNDGEAKIFYDEIINQIKSLKSEIEKIQYSNVKLKDKITQVSADVEYRISQLEKNAATPQKEGTLNSTLSSIDNTLKTNNSDFNNHVDGNNKMKLVSKTPEEQYQDAYTLLKSTNIGGSYTKAIKAFKKFIDSNPQNSLVGNAYYWIGEAYSNNKDFENAAVQYLNGYKSNSITGRAADNLFGLGKSLLKLNKKQEACGTFIKLKTNFPKMNNAMARSLEIAMKQANCM